MLFVVHRKTGDYDRIDLLADVEPFSYAGDPQPTATIGIAAFSPRTLMQELAIEVPPTAEVSVVTSGLLDDSVNGVRWRILFDRLGRDQWRVDQARTAYRCARGDFQVNGYGPRLCP